ncbi:MAG: 30S ribosomal protein S6 [Clostridia bacterium]|nr:30S ribosomal protein S6 [Clostridia bacterium]
MNNYEVLYIIKAEVADEAKEALIERFQSLVTENGGTVEKVDKWGMKKFAYPIDYKTEGYYVLMNFSAPATLPKEMERLMGITDDVVRCMVIRK